MSFASLAALDGITRTWGLGRHAFIAPNGAGKSTLPACLGGQLRPAVTGAVFGGPQLSGHVLLDGRRITRHGVGRRARAGIGRTFQTPRGFASLSVAQHLDVADRQMTATARDALLDTVGLDPTVAGRRAGQLPHGQRRLLDLALALASRPRVLLLDEPAAGLTDDEQDRLIDLLQHLDEVDTLLLVEHDLGVVTAVADTVTVLDHGRILAHGTPDEVIADPRVHTAYLGAGEQPC